LHVLLP